MALVRHVAVGQNQWYHFGVGAPPTLFYFSGDWDVHWGYGILTHGHVLPALRCHNRARQERFFASLARASVARCERFSVEDGMWMALAACAKPWSEYLD